ETWQAVPPLVIVQSVEGVIAQAKPNAVWIEAVHHFLPQRDWQPEFRFAVPGQLTHLKVAAGALVEHATAEQKRERRLTLAQGMEVFCGCYVEVVTARNRQLHRRAAAKGWNHRHGVGPQQRLHRLCPALRVVEQLIEPALFFGRIAPARG